MDRLLARGDQATARGLPDRLLVLRAIDRTHLSEADQLSYDVFRRNAEENVEGARFPSELLAVSQRDGPQYASGVIARMPTVTASDYEHIVARLTALPQLIEQTMVLLDSGAVIGVTPPRVTLRGVPAQIAALVPDIAMRSALLLPFTHMPSTIPLADRERLTTQAVRRIHGSRAAGIPSAPDVPLDVVHPARARRRSGGAACPTDARGMRTA